MAACGRKKQSGVWQFFVYDVKINKSQCSLKNKEKECKVLLVGKNASNLKAHLLSYHPDEYNQVLTQDADERKYKTLRLELENKSNSKVMHSTAATQQTIEKCFASKIHSYSTSSLEYEAKTEALINMIVDECYPTSITSQSSFQEFCRKMDPKYNIPGIQHLLHMLYDYKLSIK
jgi:hypothetical protein